MHNKPQPPPPNMAYPPYYPYPPNMGYPPNQHQPPSNHHQQPIYYYPPPAPYPYPYPYPSAQQVPAHGDVAITAPFTPPHSRSQSPAISKHKTKQKTDQNESPSNHQKYAILYILKNDCLLFIFYPRTK